MKRWLTVVLSAGAILGLGAFAYAATSLGNKYDSWMEDQINEALGTSLTYSEKTGKYAASTSRPDNSGFTYSDAIVEIEPDAFAEFLNEASFPGAWERFEGNNPPIPVCGSDTLPWWREQEHNASLEHLGWGTITEGYQRVVASETGTLVFLLVPERRLLRWRLYTGLAQDNRPLQ